MFDDLKISGRNIAVYTLLYINFINIYIDYCPKDFFVSIGNVYSYLLFM